MRVLAVHPGPLMYTKVFLRLEPLGVELVAAAIRARGHEVRIVDLQVEGRRDYFRHLERWRPEAVLFSCNYLANVPEIIELAKLGKRSNGNLHVFVGGHSASFIAEEILEHAAGAIDGVVRGEGEVGAPRLIDALAEDRNAVREVPGIVTTDGAGPPPQFVDDLNALLPARDLLHHRRKYFIGELDPCASIEFSRGCPWDCAFCSAWTFYGRSYRIRHPDHIIEELRSIREPGIFIVDDVAFIQSRQGFEIGERIAREGIRKRFYLETRGDVLLRHRDVFKFWKDLGVEYLFLGLEAIDEDGLQKFRKRVNLGQNFEALEVARSLGFTVAVNIIADPDWDRDRFRVLREWALETPEIVNISVNTPYPGTETWLTESRRLTTRDYRLFDIQHAVLPTRMPLAGFYTELFQVQQVLNRKHLRGETLLQAAGLAAGLLMRGQTNFVRMLFKFNGAYHPAKLMADHARHVDYEIPLPPAAQETVDPRALYVHASRGRRGRAIDDATEHFVEATRMGSTA